MKKIEMEIECQACKGSGVYTGMGEREGAAVVCHKCDGTGAYQYKFSYNEFTGRKQRDDVARVYKSGYGYVISTGNVKFGDVDIDMDKEGVSYQEFMNGHMPKHSESIACPMLADQGLCHKIPGFVDECMELNGGWVGQISSCKNQCNKRDCWKRFNDAQDS
jgi:hypothetical protein